jgi:hypothetical protein
MSSYARLVFIADKVGACFERLRLQFLAWMHVPFEHPGRRVSEHTSPDRRVDGNVSDG